MKMRVVLAAAWVLAAMPAMALELHDARAQGLVGEQADGYATALKPSAEVNALVGQINAKRKAEYTRISKENGQPVNVVGKLAAPQIVQKLEAGASYQDSNGNWQKR